MGAHGRAIRGHAVEARVYAEDPAAGFLPTGGRVELLDLPHWPGVRIDSALRAGDVVDIGFDPLLAKVIAWAEDRPAALARLRATLAETRVVGVTTNLGFLLDALAHPDVVAGTADTDWVESTWARTSPRCRTGCMRRAAGAIRGGRSGTRRHLRGDRGRFARPVPWMVLHPHR